MYRFIIFLAIFNFASSHWCRDKPAHKGIFSRIRQRHGWHRPLRHGFKGRCDDYGQETPDIKPIVEENQDKFEEIANGVIKMDKKLQNLCADTKKSRNVTEVYKQDGYTISYVLHEFTKPNVDIKVKHRVMLANVTEEDKSFMDIMILSDILNVDSASWYLQGKVLKILIPYKLHFSTETSKGCSVVDETVSEVARMKDYIDETFWRFGETNVY